jgi:hypothetical protein
MARQFGRGEAKLGAERKGTDWYGSLGEDWHGEA